MCNHNISFPHSISSGHHCLSVSLSPPVAWTCAQQEGEYGHLVMEGIPKTQVPFWGIRVYVPLHCSLWCPGSVQGHMDWICGIGLWFEGAPHSGVLLVLWDWTSHWASMWAACQVCVLQPSGHLTSSCELLLNTPSSSIEMGCSP